MLCLIEICTTERVARFFRYEGALKRQFYEFSRHCPHQVAAVLRMKAGLC